MTHAEAGALAKLLTAHGWEPVPGVSWPEDAPGEEEYDLPAPPTVVQKRRRRVEQPGPGLFDHDAMLARARAEPGGRQ